MKGRSVDSALHDVVISRSHSGGGDIGKLVEKYQRMPYILMPLLK